MCFIEYRKASNLYRGQKVTAQMEYMREIGFKYKGVRQGSIFSLFMPYVLRKAGLEDKHGFKTGGRNFINLCYTCVTILIAENAKDLEGLVMTFKEHGEKMGIINESKIKPMITSNSNESFNQ